MTEEATWNRYLRWHEQWVEGREEELAVASEMDARRELNECLDEYAKIKRELFMDGFADFVVKQGFCAVTPNMINGKPESWQSCGRRLWGRNQFDEAMRKAIERSRGGRTSSRTSQGSS